MPRNQPDAGPGARNPQREAMTTPDHSAGPRDATAYVEYATREVWNIADLPPETAATREMLCELDRRGQKTRSGFYDYDENRVASPSPVTEKAVLALSAKRGIARRALSASEILQRRIYPMINEGAKILEEGTALPRTSMSSGCTATVGPRIAADRCSMPTRSDWMRS